MSVDLAAILDETAAPPCDPAVIADQARRRPRGAAFYIHPRYTREIAAPIFCDHQTAVATARAELDAYNAARFANADRRALAEQGLAGIAFARWTDDQFRIVRLDLLTGRQFTEPRRPTWHELRKFQSLRDHAAAGLLSDTEQAELAELEFAVAVHRTKENYL